MNSPGQAESLDALAMTWLDRLLDAPSSTRDVELAKLATEQPALHERLLRLLKAAEATDNSLLLQLPAAFDLPSLQHQPEATIGLNAGMCLGGYRLLRELGRGGMSAVWLAERIDGVVKRQVALKIPLFTFNSAVAVERFTRERDILAALSHPHIGQIYDASVSATGQPFIVLEFIDGVSITEACDIRHLSIRERLMLFLQVLDAVNFAHRHLIVHRDLKPSNILVDTSGQVKLLDFGIAKLLGDPALQMESTALTRDGDSVMTPRYAAPEQLNNGQISTATDVYALGVILFELLTGATPFLSESASLADWMHAVLYVEPGRAGRATIDLAAAQSRNLPDAGRLRAALKGDLETIIGKALRKTSVERYGSVERFADDIQAYLASRPISARPPSLAHISRLFIRRNRAACIAAAIGLAVAVGFASTAWQQHVESEAQRVRGDAVRNFMFELVSDAEPDEKHPNAEPTGSQMVDGAVKRARAEFKDQDRLRGELLAELGHMYNRLGNSEESAQVLTEALGLLEATAPANDPALNRTRSWVAFAIIHDDPARAAALAQAALSACDRGTECAKARYYANTVLSTLDLRRGNATAALDQMRQGVDNSEIGSGPKSPETVVALMDFAVVARNVGHLTEAVEALNRALALSQQTTLRQADRIVLERNRGILSLDLGNYAAAASRFESLLNQIHEQVDQTHGQQGFLWRLLATARLGLGEPVAASDAAAAAIRLDGTSAHDSEHLFARQTEARAFAMMGKYDDATIQMQDVIKGLQIAGYSANAMEVLRARRYLSEVRLRSGDYATGLSELLELAAQQSQVAAGQEVELAQVFELIGCALRETGRANDALAWHLKARALFEKNLPADHPFLDRNTLYTIAAQFSAKAAAATGENLKRQAQLYSDRFPADSLWRRMLDEAILPGHCPDQRSAMCALIL
ncbi:serine/threonine-protein kinase [Rhodanobacter sp. A1T4]|uniref:serine/threonine-protein kinase n=1 Tax=Rhodanobacter sp. A1T4 TaxID=2723087 RepID=UPI001618D714|nr:serine/threonine-protein kinase [Rhodanobacter sp. A1T4]MBB6248879.1 serine/threonine-protein kinase [Rhodanobacter sp. A1T4]